MQADSAQSGKMLFSLKLGSKKQASKAKDDNAFQPGMTNALSEWKNKYMPARDLGNNVSIFAVQCIDLNVFKASNGISMSELHGNFRKKEVELAKPMNML